MVEIQSSPGARVDRNVVRISDLGVGRRRAGRVGEELKSEVGAGLEVKAGRSVAPRDTRGLESLGELVSRKRRLEKWIVYRGERKQRFENGVVLVLTIGRIARDPDLSAKGFPSADRDVDLQRHQTVRWRLVCPARVRALWRRALELASRDAGEPLADWRAAEIVAAEASSGAPRGASMGDRMLLEALRLARRARRQEAGAHEHEQNAAWLDERAAVDAARATTIAASRGITASQVAAFRDAAAQRRLAERS